MQLELTIPSDKEFQKIRKYISEFELDDRQLKKEEFIAAFRENELVGFGRLRLHPDCTELCSLGVITKHRRQGIGKAIVAGLLKKNVQNLYLVCIIPEFFTPFGFRTVENYPKAVENKLLYCTQELVVPETYVAMILQ
jgi:N-acetylglutamate synthase-like GNAT family acetyltransferase